MPPQQQLLRRYIPVVTVQRLAGAKQEHGAGIVHVGGAVHADDSPDLAGGLHDPVEAQVIGHQHHRQVGADPRRKQRLRAEGQGTHVGMQAVGADDDVEAPARTMLEADVAIIGDRGDRVGEEILDVAPRGVIEDLAEIVTHDLDVVVGDGRVDLSQVDADPLGALTV